MTIPPTAPSRRSTLLGLGAGVAGLLGVSGCSLNNPFSDERTPAAEATPRLEPDVAVAVEAATMVRSARAAVGRTTGAHPSLAAPLAGLAEAHAAHLDALEAAVPDGVDTSSEEPALPVPPRRRAALAALVAAEQALHDGLVGLALRAESGPFARLLGSMAAALSQQLRGLR